MKSGAYKGAVLGVVLAILSQLLSYYGATRAGAPFSPNLAFMAAIVVGCALAGGLIGLIPKR